MSLLVSNHSNKLSRGHVLLISGFASLLGKATNLLAVLITIPLTYKSLGTERFGLLMTSLSLVSVMTFSDFGLGFGLLNRISSLRGDAGKIRAAVSSVFFFLVGVAIAGFAIAYSSTLAFDYTGIFNLKNPDNRYEANQTVLVFFAVFFMSMPFGIVTRYQSAVMKTYLNELWMIGGNLLSVASVCLVAITDCSVPLMLLANYLPKAISTMFQFGWVFFCQEKSLYPSLHCFDKSMLKTIARDGVVFSILQTMAMLVLSIDGVIIAISLSASHAAIYAIAYRLYSVFMTPVQAFSSALLPTVNEAIASGDFAWIQKNFRRTIALASIASTISAIIMITSGNWLIKNWINPDLTLSTGILFAFGFYLIVSNIQDFVSPLMMVSQNLVHLIKIYSVCAITVVSIKAGFTKSLGIEGVVVVTTLGVVLLYLAPAFARLRRMRFV